MKRIQKAPLTEHPPAVRDLSPNSTHRTHNRERENTARCACLCLVLQLSRNPTVTLAGSYGYRMHSYSIVLLSIMKRG